MGTVWTETCIEPEQRPTDGPKRRTKPGSTGLYSDTDDADGSDDEKYVEPAKAESVRLLREELEGAKTELQAMQTRFASMNDDANPSEETSKLAQQLQVNTDRNQWTRHKVAVFG